MKFSFKQERFGDFSGGAVEGSPPANAGDTGSISGLGGSYTLWSSYARAPRLLSLRFRACSLQQEKPPP